MTEVQDEIRHLELYRDELLARWKASEAQLSEARAEVEKLWRTIDGQTKELADWSTRAEKAEAALEEAEQCKARQAVIMQGCARCVEKNLFADDEEIEAKATAFRAQLKADLKAIRESK